MLTCYHYYHDHVIMIMTSSTVSPVTVDMEAPVQGHHPDRLLLARGGHDGVAAHGAPGSKPPVKILTKERVNHQSFIASTENLTSMQ